MREKFCSMFFILRHFFTREILMFLLYTHPVYDNNKYDNKNILEEIF